MEINGPKQPNSIRPIAADQPDVRPNRERAAGIPDISTSTQTAAVLEALADSTSNIRENLVQEIRLKVAAGEYLQSKAVYETADAILNL